MNVTLRPYEPDMLDDMIPVIAQDSFLKEPLDSPVWLRLLGYTLSDPDRAIRCIYDGDTGEFLGYCEIQDMSRDDWEIGVTILREHWRKGAGIAGVRLLMGEMGTTYGKREFMARIVPDNVASIRMFQKLGAVPRGLERSRILLDDEDAARFEKSHAELIDDHVREMAALFGVEPRRLLSSVLVFDVPGPTEEEGGSDDE